MKYTIVRETLSAEMRLAAKKRLSFKSFVNGLRMDYNIQPIEDKLKELEYHYNTLLFMVEERKSRFNQCG